MLSLLGGSSFRKTLPELLGWAKPVVSWNPRSVYILGTWVFDLRGSSFIVETAN